jgi:hypothetical protein
MGEGLARAHETAALTYDRYCWAAGAATAVDVGQVTEALSALAADPALRRRMGDAGRRRARELYDWSVIYRQYQALWLDLQERRRAATADAELKQWIDAAPRASASGLDPFDAFGHYPTFTIASDSRLSLVPGANATDLAADLAAALDHAFFDALTVPRRAVEEMLARLQTADLTVADLARSLGIHVSIAACSAGLLVKLGLVRVAPGTAPRQA